METRKSLRKHNESKDISTKNKIVDDRSDLLSDDLILRILQMVPSDYLRYSSRNVCRRWFNLITDNILLDHTSLIIDQDNSHTVRLMDIQEEKEGLKVKEQDLDIFYNGRIKSWCNEFLLISDLEKNRTLYIHNLITNRGDYVPECSISCGGHYGCKCSVGLSYDVFKQVYKIVHVFIGPPIQWELISMNLNKKSTNRSMISYKFVKWKTVNGPSSTNDSHFYWNNPVTVHARYLHWDVFSCKYLLSMDTVKEQFRETRLPGGLMKTHYSFIEMDGFLTLFNNVSLDKINIWRLKDFQKTEWEKMRAINISSYVSSNIYPVPITIMKSMRYIIFRIPEYDQNDFYFQNGLFCYDWKDKIMKKLDIDIKPDERCVVQSTSPNWDRRKYRLMG